MDGSIAPELFVVGAPPPKRKGEKASCAYRMRMLTLELWEKWRRKLRLLYRVVRPELGLDGTNNATARSIGKSKVRGNEQNGIAPTQWLYSGEDDEQNLAKEMTA